MKKRLLQFSIASALLLAAYPSAMAQSSTQSVFAPMYESAEGAMIQQLLDLEINDVFSFFDEEEGGEHTERAYDALGLVNRFMTMYNQSGDSPQARLLWAKASGIIIARYCADWGCSRSQAQEQMREIISPYAEGAQLFMNQYSYFLSALDLYNTLDLYLSFMEEIEDANLRTLIGREYESWYDMYEARYAVYTDVTKGNQWYSMLPLEFNDYNGYLTSSRRSFLERERAIILLGMTYEMQHSTLRNNTWETFLESVESLVGTSDNSAPTQEQREVAKEKVGSFKASFEQWHSVRMEVMRYLGGNKGRDYDRLTADYHWMLVDEQLEN